MTETASLTRTGSSSRNAAKIERIIDLCDRGWPREAESLLLDSEEPDMLMAKGIVCYSLARSGADKWHEDAKDCLTRAQRLGAPHALCAVYLGLCYLRQKHEQEAGVMFSVALGDRDPHIQFLALLGQIQIPTDKKEWRESLQILEKMALLYEDESPVNKGKFHNHKGLAYRQQFEETGDDAFLDRAIQEYEAAKFHFESADCSAYEACVLNNLAYLFIRTDTKQAHDNADRSMRIYGRLDNRVGTGTVADTKAQVYLAEHDPKMALRWANESIKCLASPDDAAYLANSYFTRGKAYVDLNLNDLALADFRIAARVSENIPAIIDQKISPEYMVEFYRELPDSPDKHTGLRVIDALLGCPPDELRAINKERTRTQIREALEEAGGRVTVAARILGLKDHSTLSYLIEKQFPELKDARKPRYRRRKSLAKKK